MGVLFGFPTPLDGKSAYQEWLDNGNFGSELDFLNSLIGTPGVPGAPGAPGAPGLSAYQIWLNNGHTGTENDFLSWTQAAAISQQGVGLVVAWDMGFGGPSTQNVLNGNGSFVRIGGLVQVHGSISPTYTVANSDVVMKIKLPFSTKYDVSLRPIANKGNFGAPLIGDDIFYLLSQNSNIMRIVVNGNANMVPSVISFSFGYITGDIIQPTANALSL